MFLLSNRILIAFHHINLDLGAAFVIIHTSGVSGGERDKSKEAEEHTSEILDRPLSSS